MSSPDSISPSPRVTVCMPSYMHAKYIRQALDALSAQTYSQFKIVACDDGSTDGTYETLKEYESGKLAGKLTVITHPDHQNRGIYHTYNACLDHVDTEFFKGHASDDFWDPDALEYLVEFMDQHPEADAIYGPVKCVGGGGDPLHRLNDGGDLCRRPAGLAALLDASAITEPSMFYRSGCVAIKRSDPGLVSADFVHNVRLGFHKRLVYYPCPVVNYRAHDSNISHNVPHDEHHRRRLESLQALSDTGEFNDDPDWSGRLLLNLWVYAYYLRQRDLESSARERCLKWMSQHEAAKVAKLYCSRVPKLVGYFRLKPAVGAPAAEFGGYVLACVPTRIATKLFKVIRVGELMSDVHGLIEDQRPHESLRLAWRLLRYPWRLYLARNVLVAAWMIVKQSIQRR